MCSRFCIDQEMWRELKELLGDLDRMFSGWKWNRSGQDIRPTNQSLVITAGEDNRLAPALQRWGLPDSYHKSTIINARAETALEKRMFRDSVSHRRAAVPVSWFYEWNQNKEKYTFTREDGQVLFLAGFYSKYEDGDHFVILTTQANQSMAPVHSRMPLVLERNQVRDWIMDGDGFRELLAQVPAGLARSCEYEQQTLF